MRNRMRLWPLLLPLLGLFFLQQRAQVPEILEIPINGQWTAADRAMWKKFKMAKQGRPIDAKIPPKGHPEKFAEILHQMKTPADRDAPEYQPGYRQRELSKAMRGAKRGPALPWISRGPGNVAGRARALVVDPDDATNSTWYIGTAGGGMWKTTDAGATWSNSSVGLASMSVGALVMAPSNHDVMYAGTGEGFFNIGAVNGQGMFKSTDRGATWTLLPGTNVAAWENVTRIVVDPNDENIVLASTVTGFWKGDINDISNIWRSIDGGATWVSVHSTMFSVEQIIATPGNFNILYATANADGILKSTDAGVSWSNVLSTPGLLRSELAISPVDSDRLYASVWASVPRFFYSTDAGANWTETTNTTIGEDTHFLGGQGWLDNAIVCHPTDVNTVYVGGQRLYRLVISGANVTATQLAVGPVHVDYHGLTVLDDGGGNWRILAVNDGGVGISGNEDTNWTDPKDGMLTTQFYGADKRPGRSQYVGGMQDNGSWISAENPGQLDNWSEAFGGDGFEASWHFFDSNKIMVSAQFNNMQRTLDGGLTWNSVGPGNGPFISRLGKTNQFPQILLAVSESGVYRTTNFGDTWTLINVPIRWGTGAFRDVRMSSADGNICWAGAGIEFNTRVQVSTDRGVTWNQTSNYTTATLGTLSGISTHPTDPNTAYACFSFGQRPKILRTTDLGVTWTDITGFETSTVSTNGFPDVATYDVMVFPNDTNKIWAGTEIGLVESLDGGATWAMANNGFPQPASIWQVRQIEDEVVVATHGSGIWSVTIPGMSAGSQYRPLLDSAAQGPSGVVLDLNLRSAYDSTDIRVNGATVQTLGLNAAFDKPAVVLPVIADDNWDVRAHSFIGGTEFVSIIRNLDVFALQVAQPEFSTDFEPDTGDLTQIDGFSVGPNVSFVGNSLNTAHRYADSSQPISYVRVPITVAHSNATLEFDEVVLVEPGDPGSEFGGASFWDYVIVEGSTDGIQWKPLLDGYDSNDDPAWLAEWNSLVVGSNSFGTGEESLYRHRVINMLDTFNPGETILVRFRMFADGFVNGWGWAIDNIEIQTGVTGTDSPTGLVSMQQNFPNPFNPSTVIRYTVATPGLVLLKVYDLRGREVRTLVNGVQDSGPQSIEWSGKDNAGRGVASGTYIYRLVAREQTIQKKMTLLK